MHMLSPSDIVGPSPVTSNGTETTEIEDDFADDIDLDHIAGGHPPHHSDVSNKCLVVYCMTSNTYVSVLT